MNQFVDEDEEVTPVETTQFNQPQPVEAGSQPIEVDPFAAENFATESQAIADVSDLTIELGAPSDESFVRVSPDPRHSVLCTLLVVSREDGYGKSYFLLTPTMRGWALKQPSLKKFVKTMHLFLFVTQDGDYGLWPVRDSLDNWSVSDRQVVEIAKKTWARRYNQGKVRKAHTTTAIDAEPIFPNKDMFGQDGILAQVFGEAFVITSPDAPVIRKLLGQ
jgi:hypothetical protein